MPLVEEFPRPVPRKDWNCDCRGVDDDDEDDEDDEEEDDCLD